MTKISLGIIDDDQLIVSLLQNFFESQDNFQVNFTANDGNECLTSLANAPRPTILLMDLKMKGMDGIELASTVKELYPDIQIIIISSHYNLSFMGFMLKTGVSAFIPKGVSTKELTGIIQQVDEHGFYFTPEQMNTVRSQISSKSPKPILSEEEKLTEREIEILSLICQQKTAKEIGEKLFITKRTVEGHKNNLFVKTGAKNIAGLVIYAIQNNIIDLNHFPLLS